MERLRLVVECRCGKQCLEKWYCTTISPDIKKGHNGRRMRTGAIIKYHAKFETLGERSASSWTEGRLDLVTINP